MPKTYVAREIQIATPVSGVYAQVFHFKNWPDWSPWLVVEPDCKLTFAPDGTSYSWEGKRIGAGTIRRLGQARNREISFELRILKPWRTTSGVEMQFSETEDGTQVKWTMEGSLPLPLFWMKGMVEGMVGMDYQRGLMRLKDRCEKGEVPSNSTVTEHLDFPGCRGVGTRTFCPMQEVGPRMESDFKKLLELLEKHNCPPSGEPFAIYHAWKLAKGHCAYTLGFPVEEIPQDLPDTFAEVEIPAGDCFVVDHTGAYRHLGDAWALGMTHGRCGTFTKDRRCDPFEVYRSDPRSTPEDQQQTRLHFPRKD